MIPPLRRSTRHCASGRDDNLKGGEIARHQRKRAESSGAKSPLGVQDVMSELKLRPAKKHCGRYKERPTLA